MSREVVLSGVGAFSACGRGVDAAAAAIAAGRSACARDEALREVGSRCLLSARVPGVDEAFAELDLPADDRPFFGRFARLGAVAAFDALRASGRTSVGRVLVASGAGPMGELEAGFRDALGRTRPPPARERHPFPAHALTRQTPSFLATYLAGTTGAERGGHAVSCACASAMVALEQAFELVRSGREEACLVGGVEEDSPFLSWAFDRQRLLTHAASPEARSRPLSGEPGGFFQAGGAAFFVLEDGERARARGATPSARLTAVALQSSRDAATPISFPGRAYRDAIGEVIERSPGAIDLVMAHAPPTLADAEELSALASVLGPTLPPVRSFKSILGYTLGASVALDVALAAWQLERSEVLPNDLDRLDARVEAYAEALVGSPTRLPRRVLKTVYAQGFSAGALVLEAA